MSNKIHIFIILIVFFNDRIEETYLEGYFVDSFDIKTDIYLSPVLSVKRLIRLNDELNSLDSLI